MSGSIHILGDFEKLSFGTIPEVAFSNRLETKFILPEIELPNLLKALSAHYSVVTFDGNPLAGYSTLYYDTNDLSLYLAHHNKRAQRYKIRKRTYLNNNNTYLEVKSQTRAKKANKDRVKQKDNGSISWTKNELDFLSTKSPFDPKKLIPTVLSNYSRITLVNKTQAERLTIDLNLSFSGNQSMVKNLDNLVIVETKQASREWSPAWTALKNSGVRPIAISKYCLGINYLYPLIKKNNFKQRLNAINQIMHHDASTNSIV